MVRKLTYWAPAAMAIVALTVLASACGGGTSSKDKTATAGAGGKTPAATGTAAAGATTAPLSGKLEIFSWWTTGGEAAGLRGALRPLSADLPG